MSKTLYLECASGISGDMTVAALLDLGADQNVLDKALKSLPVDGFTTRISRVSKSGLDCCDFAVLLDAEHENHDHDMEYLHGHEHSHDHDHHDHDHHDHDHNHDHHDHDHHDHDHHDHDHDHNHHDHDHDHDHHDHDHNHDHDHDHHDHDHHHHAHGHVHRGLPEIFDIIQQADLTANAKTIACRIFDIIGDAEAKAHGVPKNEVHFHEVGAVDSIVDIVSVAVLVDNLGVTDTIVTGLSEGSGTIRCQHGIIPVPVPAVMHIVQANNLILRLTGVKGELVTPTGAAIAAALKTSDRLPDRYRILGVGHGAGKRNYELPSLLRAMLIEAEDEKKDVVWKLESNIDDCSGEELGYCMELLMEAGARDVHYTPVYMKKNRPAYQLNVICKEDKREELEAIIFSQTTTIGIRRVAMERSILARRSEKVATPYGEADVKITSYGGRENCYPEYNSVTRLSSESGLSYRECYDMIRNCWAGK